MVIRKKGSVFFIDGKEFKIGGGVFANDESEYMGLYGTVTEIRTDEDRETENDTPDIYCEFMSPDSVNWKPVFPICIGRICSLKRSHWTA